MEVTERILRKTELVDETFCWRWAGSMSGRKRYGKITVGGRSRLAHRVAYELFRDGREIEGKQIHHTCLNKWCVNPWHMKAVTPAEHIEVQGTWGRPKLSLDERRSREREYRRTYRLRYPDKYRDRTRTQHARYRARHPDKYREAKKAQKTRYREKYPDKWRERRRAKEARHRARFKIQNILASFGDPGWEIKAARLLAA